MSDRFDLAAPVPPGRWLLEASAGTGKTHAIVAMATRLLAEGACRTDNLLVVTFSRAATRELRGRLLTRLAATTALLEATVEGRPAGTAADEVDEVLLALPPDDRRAHRDRLVAALATIDHATVTTIHGLCDDLLRRVGDPLLGELLEDDRSLAAEVLGDIYVRVARHREDYANDLPYPGTEGLQVIRAGMTHPADAIVPTRTLDKGLPGVRSFMAFAAGKEAVTRKAGGRVHTYDDLLTRLAEVLTADGVGAALAARLRDRFTVGLVDEFQDTDPTQWQILSTIFDLDDDPSGSEGSAGSGEGPSGQRLILVGDPKQAIYAFRGADIATYQLARTGTPQRSLPVNRRSDPALVRAVLALFGDTELGPDVVVPAVEAHHTAARLRPAPAAPISLRVIGRGVPVATGRYGPLVDSVRDVVAADVGAHVVELLDAGTQVRDGGVGEGDSQDGWRDVRPSDLTVLVRTNAQALRVRRHLEARQVPTVLNGVGNVMATRAARDWLAVLRAVQQPALSSPARIAALTDVVGWSTHDLVTADDTAIDGLHVLLHDAAEVLARAGMAALWRWLDERRTVSPRLLGQQGGARRLTDLAHVAELLHAEQRQGGLGVGALIAWLEQAMADPQDPPPQALARRLEDARDAVQIMTVHGAKGLERGIVLTPYLWDCGAGRGKVFTYTDEATGRRMVDVGGYRGLDDPADKRERAWREAIANRECEEEELRLAYVAATRAKHQLVLWWGPSGSRRDVTAPLTALLGRGRVAKSAEQVVAHAGQLQAAHPGMVEVTVLEEAAPTVPLAGSQTPGLRAAVSAATFDRDVDRVWHRHSYSRLSAQAEEGSDVDVAATGGVPDPSADDPALADEEALVVPVGDVDLGAPVPLADMPGGAEVGSAVHAVLEHADFAATPERPEVIRRLLAAESRTAPVELDTVPGVVEGIGAVLDTPLGRVAGGLALADLTRADRLDELAFEFPVVGGRDAVAADRLLLADLADVLADHLPADDPLAAYPEHLRRSLGEVEVRGYLAGFVDLVARVPGPDGGPSRFLVADYKTNRVAPSGADTLRVGHYTPQAMAAEMMHHHYPLQAMLYVVATHRYLRWRVPSYDPDTHLAGVAYLFMRGMVGPDTPVDADGRVNGVFTWEVPTPLLLDLDRVMAEGGSRG